MAFHDEARHAGGGRASEMDHAGLLISSESNLTAAEKQRLVEALVAYDTARLRVLIGDDHVRAFGIEAMHDLPGILTERIRAIRLALAYCGRSA